MLVLKKDRNLHAAMRILRIFEFVFLFFLRRAGLGRGMSARGEKSGYRRSFYQCGAETFFECFSHRLLPILKI